MRLKLIPIIGAALALAACNGKPLIEASAPRTQPLLKGSQEWQALAVQAANELTAALGNIPDESAGDHIFDGKGVPRTIRSRPIYVAGDASSPFVSTFRGLLATELVRQGFTVATTPANAVIVNTQTQVVPMADPSRPPIPLGLPITAAAYYGAQASHWVHGPAEGALSAIPIVAAVDALFWLTNTPNTEVVVTMQVMDEHRYLFRKNAVYYVDDADAPTYQSAPSKMITTMQATPVALRSIPLSSN